MKGSLKAIITIALCLVVIGAVVFGIGYMMSGNGADGEHETSRSLRTYVQETGNVSAFDEMDIETSSEDINITTGDHFEVSYKLPDDVSIDIDVKDERLVIRLEHPFTIFGFDTQNSYINVLVPAGEYDAQISSTSGDVSVSNIDLSGSLNSTSGDVSVSGVEGDGFKVDTTSGDVTVEKLKGKKVSLQSTSGEIEVSECTADELKLDSTSGDIYVKYSEADSLDVNSTSGMTTLVECKAEKLEQDSSSGDFTATLCKFDDINAESSSGNIKIELDGYKRDDFDYKISTASGDIKVGDMELEKELKMNNDADGKIEIDTASGDIEVSFN